MKLSVETVAKACDALTKSGIVDKNGEYDKEFKGYTSSFGVAVVQMGLYPALLIFEDENAGTKGDRSKLAKALRIFLNEKDHNVKKLSELYVELKVEERKLMQKRVNEALVALKLALRIYKPKDEKIQTKINHGKGL